MLRALTPCTLFLAVAGCRDAATTPPPAEPVVKSAPATAAPATAPAPAAAPADPAARLAGAWKPDLAQVATDPEILKLPRPQQLEAVELARGLLDKLTIEFTAAGAVTLRHGSEERTGTYTILPTTEGLELRVTTARAEEAPREERLDLAFEQQAIRLTTPDGKATRFIRR
ncbi:MAG: hypothetical protein R3F60_14390 [bacterium]